MFCFLCGRSQCGEIKRVLIIMTFFFLIFLRNQNNKQVFFPLLFLIQQSKCFVFTCCLLWIQQKNNNNNTDLPLKPNDRCMRLEILLLKETEILCFHRNNNCGFQFSIHFGLPKTDGIQSNRLFPNHRIESMGRDMEIKKKLSTTALFAHNCLAKITLFCLRRNQRKEKRN